MRHTWKNAAHLRKCDTLGKMGYIQEIQANYKNVPHVRKCGTLEKMRHS